MVRKIADRLVNVDPRLIYLLFAVVLAVAATRPIRGLPAPSPATEEVFAKVASLAPGSTLVMGFEFGSQSEGEVAEQAAAMLRHALSRNLKVVGIALTRGGEGSAEELFRRILAEYPGKSYGTDVVNLGFRSGGVAYLHALAWDLRGVTLGVDSYGTDLAGMAAVGGLSGLSDVSLVAVFAPEWQVVKDYIAVIRDALGLPLVAGSTSMGSVRLAPLVTQGRLDGMLDGLRGAAEYEVLSGITAEGVHGLQVVAVIVPFLAMLTLAGFVSYTLSTRRMLEIERGARPSF